MTPVLFQERTLKTIPALLLCASVAGPALAQTPPAAPQAPAAVDVEVHARMARDLAQHAAAQARHAMAELAPMAAQMALAAEFDDPFFGFAGRELGREAVVKGAPYCATAVHETVQVLADGNRIVKRQSTPLCRDGEGRTRREVQVEGGPRRIYLSDPVARTQWVLDPDKKIARPLIQVRSAHAELFQDQARQHQALSERMRANSERWGEWARELAQRAQFDWQRAPAPGKAEGKPEGKAAAEPGVVVEREIVVREGAAEPQRHREVRVVRLSDLPAMGAMPPMPPMPPLPPLPMHGLMPRGEGVTTALPAKEIDGVKVNGERTTWTLEAGKIGNEKPIVTVREVWKSPELMLTVSSKDSDPRSGEVSYRLELLKRGEPDPALMKVPADYEQQPLRRPAGPKAAPSAPAAPAAPAKPKA
jgi:hypothetical protein